MNSIYKLSLAVVVSLLLISSSCKKDDPIIPNEEELITTLIYTLTPVAGGETVEMTFRDLDGDGGNAPVITGGTLQANTVYNASLNLLNESATPAENISDEIDEEAEHHQFFFSVAGSLEMDISYADQDSDGRPLGLLTTVDAGNVSSGQLTITLRHEPDKSATGVTDGDITNAGGETDIEVTFDVNIE